MIKKRLARAMVVILTDFVLKTVEINNFGTDKTVKTARNRVKRASVPHAARVVPLI